MSSTKSARARSITFSITVVAWLGACALVLWRLIRQAAEAPPATIEEYARMPSFQVLNFAIGYLPKLILLLLVVLGVEYAALRMAEWRRDPAGEA